MGLQSVRAHRILIPNKNIDLHVFICISLNVTHSSRQGLSQTTRARRAWRHHLVQFSVFGTEKGQHQHHLTDVADQWPKSSSGIFCVGQLILFVYELENWSPDSWPIALQDAKPQVKGGTWRREQYCPGRNGTHCRCSQTSHNGVKSPRLPRLPGVFKIIWNSW